MSENLRAPENTEAFSPATLLAEAAIFGASESIVRQEAHGQRSFVNSDTLPRDISPEDRATLEAAGVEFLQEVADDRLFQYVRLPAGWTKRATDHSMWSELRAADGTVIGKIFYKAAHYDRCAFFRGVR